jgi:hypothetical protein
VIANLLAEQAKPSIVVVPSPPVRQEERMSVSGGESKRLMIESMQGQINELVRQMETLRIQSQIMSQECGVGGMSKQQHTKLYLDPTAPQTLINYSIETKGRQAEQQQQ